MKYPVWPHSYDMIADVREETWLLTSSGVGEGDGTHSSTLAWTIPWTEEPAGLQSMGSRRVRHDWATSLSLFTFMHWRRTWQPTPVFLPGESQGQRNLAATVHGVTKGWTRLSVNLAHTHGKSYHRNTGDFWEGKMIGHWKRNSPGWQVPDMLLEIGGEITPERMEGWSQSKHNTQLWMGLVIEARYNAGKNNIA